MALVSFPFLHVHGGDSRASSGPTLKLKGDPKQWLASNDPLFTEEIPPNSDPETSGPTSISINENLHLDLDEEVGKEAGFEGMVGQSSALRQVLRLIQTVATGDSTVLLLGETGTGKELIARAIHNRSRRKERNFVKLNCAAIPTGLLESELFGHERGAFTGAI